ncbi:D,D-heptose 1,7-bisphosphate phosphatase [Sulfurifustis variabilis]|uniref:D,D-heptose 1,7-bisphosphate phosphatase n=1 Tax=Sulfurifustis variabilis TaxID=1675686 RepID=A0A1B4V9C6_9GAMM|nr:D-glycero-beta-D-manno-heptose 1,7-bisphosphate 7-phosphatase [Sulfurifustis variabilis]BAU50149.1 D,D-heptose 1,7-bisphosphate phosphatase [Sulfurifustis variabilis]
MKLVILDRDGVINYDSDAYVKSPEEWVPIPGSLEAISRLYREGYRLIVASNQSGVARGLFDIDTLVKIQLKMVEAVRAKGGELEAVFFCPHGPDDGCRCRKPLPGLFEEIADRLGTSLTGVYAIGDTERDIIAARAAQARPVLVKTGKGRKTLARSKELAGVPVYDDLAGFADALLTGSLPA